MANRERTDRMAEPIIEGRIIPRDKSFEDEVPALSEHRKAELLAEAHESAKKKLLAQMERNFIRDAEREAMELMRPRRPDDDMISMIIDVPDMTGLLIDGRWFQHGKEVIVCRTEFDNMRGMMAAAWRADRELSNPYSGSKFYRPPLKGHILRGDSEQTFRN